MDHVTIGQLVAHRNLGIGRVVKLADHAAFVLFVRHGVEVEKEIALEWLEAAPADAVAPTIEAVRSVRDTRRRNDGRLWEDSELTVLIAAFFRNEFSAGDDEHVENHELAAAFGRSRAAVDRQWRNVADLVEGKNVLHVGDNVANAVSEYARDPGAGRARARRAARRNAWPVEHLI